MKAAALFFFLVSSISYANDCEIEFIKGTVKITDGKESILPEKGKKFSYNADIITEGNGSVLFRTPKGSFKIKENMNIRVDKVVNFDRFIGSTVTHVTSARGLYENIQDQLHKESKMAFEQYTAMTGKEENYRNWKSPIESAFQKLIKAKNTEAFTLEYAVIPNSSFNASAFPGGQFIIHTGALDLLDQKVDEFMKKKNRAETQRNIYREYYIAAILSHELSHYYNQHSLKAQLKIIGEPAENELKEAAKYLENIKFGQDLELDADMSGFFLMKKAGYDPEWMVTMLGILKDLYSDSKKNSKNSVPYFESHPSPNERLAKIPNDRQEWYLFLSKMEQVFADIQLGTNLSNSVLELNNALKKYPDNAEFMKAKAAALHKIWMNTASLDDLVLRTILDMPAFRDDMIEDSSSGRKGEKKTPGDPASYYAAMKAYREVFKKTVSPEPSFLSNYAALLIYSTEEKEIKNAVELAEQAFKSGKSIQTANNLGMVYWISENHDKSLEIFSNLAKEIDGQLIMIAFSSAVNPSVKNAWENFRKEVTVRSSFDPNYTADQFTPVLNYALAGGLKGKKDILKQTAESYLKNFENDSAWAKYLAEKANIDIAASEAVFEADGITAGDSAEKLESKWGKPDRTEKLETGKITKEMLHYDKKNAAVQIQNEKVTLIRIQGKSVRVNRKLAVGYNVSQAEAALGKSSVSAKTYLLYRGKQKLRLNIHTGSVNEILIY